MMRTLVLTLALVAAPASTVAPAADRQTPVATPAGKAENCIPLRRLRETRVRDDRTIDFVMTDRRVYRNALPGFCPGLGIQRSFSYATSLSQLCSVDIITVLQTAPVGPGASCGLGPFQPVTLAGRCVRGKRLASISTLC